MAARSQRRSATAGAILPDRAYHLTDADNWPSIERFGLLSTRELLALAGLPEEECERLGRRHRPAKAMLAPGITITDQRPMPSAALRRCLAEGASPESWYALLNSRVFFWFDPNSLDRQRRAGGAPSQVVMVMDVGKLLAKYANRISLAPINTGAAMRKPARRGPSTFVPYASWVASGWETEAQALGMRPRPRSHKPAEMTVDVAVPDALECTVDVRKLEPHEVFAP